MSNFGFIIDSLNGGGAERAVLNLTKEIVKLGHVVHIFILKDEIDFKIDKSMFKLHVISKNGKVHPIRFFNKRKLANLLLKKIDEQNIKFSIFVSNLELSDEVTKIAKLPNLYHCLHGVLSEFIKSKYTQINVIITKSLIEFNIADILEVKLATKLVIVSI